MRQKEHGFLEESTFNFSIGSGSTIVDLENSTDEKLYCYEYITLDVIKIMLK